MRLQTISSQLKTFSLSAAVIGLSLLFTGTAHSISQSAIDASRQLDEEVRQQQEQAAGTKAPAAPAAPAPAPGAGAPPAAPPAPAGPIPAAPPAPAAVNAFLAAVNLPQTAPFQGAAIASGQYVPVPAGGFTAAEQALRAGKIIYQKNGLGASTDNNATLAGSLAPLENAGIPVTIQMILDLATAQAIDADHLIAVTIAYTTNWTGRGLGQRPAAVLKVTRVTGAGNVRAQAHELDGGRIAYGTDVLPAVAAAPPIAIYTAATFAAANNAPAAPAVDQIYIVDTVAQDANPQFSTATHLLFIR